VSGRTIQSVFIGGGTPSLMPASGYKRLFQVLRQEIEFAPDCEVTLEANPGTIEHDLFAAYRDAGINRVSLGVQSFAEDKLKQLGRIHGHEEIHRAVAELRASGLTNFNIDIMHGLPGQQVQQALGDLQQAIALAPTHLSWYQLTLEPNTLFYAKPPVLPEESVLADIETEGLALLEENGYQRYEISAYAKEAMTCRHNINYWQFGDYLGVGAGAHGKVTTDEGVIRYSKYKHPKRYLDAEIPFQEQEYVLDQDALISEFLLNALRLIKGFTQAQFEQRTGLPLALIGDGLVRAQSKGLLTIGDSIKATTLGFRYLNNLLVEILD